MEIECCPLNLSYNKRFTQLTKKIMRIQMNAANL
jgi:hypothetical protein